jgi:uncharacterized protein YigE (DUF2233 family)
MAGKYLKIIAAGLFIVLAVWLVSSRFFRRISPVAPPISVNPTPARILYKTVKFRDQTYAYGILSVSSSSAIRLIPNYAEKLTVENIMRQEGCSGAVNGGFYSVDNQPLGLVIAEHRLIANRRSSSLFNGIFLVGGDKTARIITQQNEIGNPRIALQSGPVLIASGSPSALTISGDKPARRVVVALTPTGQMIFLTVFLSDSPVTGPELADMPPIVQLIESVENIKLSDALNLDGGTASAFYSGSLNLTEINPVGSVFCLN